MTIGKKVVGDGKDALFLLGYGLNFEQPGTIWMMDCFEREGIGTTFVSLPTEIADHKADLVDPCREVEEGFRDHVLIGLSLGGLTAAFMDRSRKRIFLSPFWGINDHIRHRGMDVTLAMMRIFHFRSLRRRFEVKDAGYYAVEEDLKGIPEAISITTVQQMIMMQSEVPPLRRSDIVYRSRDDAIISHSTIDSKGIPIVEFEGGHLIHLVKERDRVFEGIIGTINSTLER